MIDVRHGSSPDAIIGATNEQLRAKYVIDGLFVDGEVHGVYTHEDRMIVAGAVPGDRTLDLPSWDVVGTAQPLDRRELGIVNVGGTGEVLIDGAAYELGQLDALYVGRGSRVQMRGPEAAFYLVSAIADITHPVGQFSRDSVTPMEIGDPKDASKRFLYRYVTGGTHPSCQLQFGVTVVAEGSVWNTMPPHLHGRRTEVYLYTGLRANGRIVHLMGEPGATRHLIVSDRQAVISPPWSVHAGVGTASYAFVWAMAGENTDYSDVCGVPLEAL